MRRIIVLAALSLAIPMSAPVTKLSDTPVVAAPAAAAPQGSSSPDVAAMETWLKGYDAAFNAKDLEKLATFYHPDVTIYEGGGINNGWADYRDKHLGPELKQFENPQLAHSNTKVTLLGDGRSAYVTSMYALKAKMGERDIDSGGLETLVLVKDTGGAWKIRHSHTSARARRPPAAGQDPANTVFEHYEAIRVALSADELKGIPEHTTAGVPGCSDVRSSVADWELT